MEKEILLTVVAVVGTLLGTLLGTLGGAFLNHRLEKQRTIEHYLMSSKKETYSKYTGFSRNLILNNFTSDEHKNLQRVISEAVLICNPAITQKIKDFGNDLESFILVKNEIGNKEILGKLKSLETKFRDDIEGRL